MDTLAVAHPLQSAKAPTAIAKGITAGDNMAKQLICAGQLCEY